MGKEIPHLKPYERHVACILSGLMAGLGIFAAMEGSREGTGDQITVHVVGAAKTSQIEIPAGATLDDALVHVGLSADADLSELDGTRRLTNGEILVVPYKNTTTLYVTGAVVEPKVVVLEKDAKPLQILNFIQPQEDADLSTLHRRKAIRNASVLEIKRKKPSKNHTSRFTRQRQAE
jgi:hypothetical protein